MHGELTISWPQDERDADSELKLETLPDGRLEVYTATYDYPTKYVILHPSIEQEEAMLDFLLNRKLARGKLCQNTGASARARTVG